jgi:hypothetical protein
LFRELSLGRCTRCVVVGQELWWAGDDARLCSIPLPVPLPVPTVTSTQRPVITRRPAYRQAGCYLVSLWFDPTLPDRLLVLAEEGLFDYRLHSGQWREVWSDFKQSDGSAPDGGHRRFSCIDAVYYFTTSTEVYRVDRRTGLVTTPAVNREDDRQDGALLFSPPISYLSEIEAVPDGSRVFVHATEYWEDGVQRFDTLIEFGRSAPHAATVTHCRIYKRHSDDGFEIQSMCWLPSERLLVGDSAGRVHSYDLLAAEWHVVAQMPMPSAASSPSLTAAEVTVDSTRRLCFVICGNKAFELDIRALLPAALYTCEGQIVARALTLLLCSVSVCCR